MRAALPASITWLAAELERQEASRRCRGRRPRARRRRAASAPWWRENIGSSGRPLIARTCVVVRRAAGRSRRRCAGPASSSIGPSGSPVARSHSSSDSRCVLRPTAATGRRRRRRGRPATAAWTLRPDLVRVLLDPAGPRRRAARRARCRGRRSRRRRRRARPWSPTCPGRWRVCGQASSWAARRSGDAVGRRGRSGRAGSSRCRSGRSR